MATKEQRAQWKAAGKRREAQDAVVNAEQRKAQKRTDRLYMLGGGLLIAFGVGFTVWSYTAASDTGGRYSIMYGPIVVGLVVFFKGALSKY